MKNKILFLFMSMIICLSLCSFVKVNANEHIFEKHEAITATCDKNGNKEYYTCNEEECKGKFFIKVAGVMHEVNWESEIEIKALGHALSHVEKLDATCKSEGHYAYWYCARCKSYFQNQECTKKFNSYEDTVIPKLAHKWNNKVAEHRDPTCIVEGYDKYICNLCGDSKFEYIKTIEHEYKLIDEKDPTCTEKGFKSSRCSMCNDSKYEELKALGHSLSHELAKEVTCEEDGNLEFWSCSRCKKLFKNEKLSEEFKDLEETVLKATGHSISHVERKEPTEIEEGNIEYWYCESCDKYFADEKLETELNNEEIKLDILETIEEEINEENNEVIENVKENSNVLVIALSVAAIVAIGSGVAFVVKKKKNND